MKKFFILILALASVVGITAQETNSNTEATPSPYKLQKGSVTTELLFSPFSINVGEDGISTGPFKMPELRVRVGLSNKLALRVNLGLDFGHDQIKKNINNIYHNYYYEKIVETGTNTNKNNYTEFSIAPGVEYHFGKWERLSIYVGGEILFGLRTTKSTDEVDTRIDFYEGGEIKQTTNNISTLKTKNCIPAYICGPWGCEYSYLQNGKIFLGINALAGFDFYVYKGLYLGAELSLGYVHSFALKGTVKGKTTIVRNGITESETFIDKKFDDKIIAGKFAFKCNPMIRLGWKF
jgi:hypothetical protein